MFARLIAVAALAGCAAAPLPLDDPHTDAAMRGWAAACEDWDEWDKPGPPFRIHGQTYYVGTCGISAILIVGPEGHTLIDSGTEKGAEVVLANIRALGFDPQDVDTLLTSHEHIDHVGGIARLQEATGAVLVASPRAAPVLEGGAADPEDPQAGLHARLPAAHVGATLELANDEARFLAATEIRAIATPGHTPGALTWQWQSCDSGAACQTIVYADSLTPVSRDGYRFSDHPAYLARLRQSIERVAALDCTLLLAPHPSAARMRERILAGGLADKDGCRAYAAGLRKRLDERLAEEAAGG